MTIANSKVKLQIVGDDEIYIYIFWTLDVYSNASISTNK